MRTGAIGVLLLAGIVTSAAHAQTAAGGQREGAITAMTTEGEQVRLYPNGRWEYVDAKKAETQRPAVEAYDKERSLDQGGILGIGRRVKPGDADYNRGSLGGKSK